MFPRLEMRIGRSWASAVASALGRLEDVAVPAKRLIIALAGTAGVNWLFTWRCSRSLKLFLHSIRWRLLLFSTVVQLPLESLAFVLTFSVPVSCISEEMISQVNN